MKLPLPTAEQLQARGEAALRPTHFASLRISLATPVSFLLVPHSCLFFFTRPPLLPRRTPAATHLSFPRTFPSLPQTTTLHTRAYRPPLHHHVRRQEERRLQGRYALRQGVPRGVAAYSISGLKPRGRCSHHREPNCCGSGILWIFHYDDRYEQIRPFWRRLQPQLFPTLRTGMMIPPSSRPPF